MNDKHIRERDYFIPLQISTMYKSQICKNIWRAIGEFKPSKKTLARVFNFNILRSENIIGKGSIVSNSSSLQHILQKSD